MLQRNATLAEIEAALEKECQQVPSIYRSKCVEFVKKYTPRIIQLLSSGVAPEQICREIGLCSSDVQGMVCLYCLLLPLNMLYLDDYYYTLVCPALRPTQPPQTATGLVPGK
jgi:hypothetical protein